MHGTYKFGFLPDGIMSQVYEYPGVWALEKTNGPERLVVAPRSEQIGWLRALMLEMPDPLFLLYVLVVSRTENATGRYQSESALSRAEADEFLGERQAYLESDGRHNIWVRSVVDESMLVYDRHNLIYAYGNLAKWKALLAGGGLAQVAEVRFPRPHSHHYHPEFDNQQRSLVGRYAWRLSALQPGDENPV